VLSFIWPWVLILLPTPLIYRKFRRPIVSNIQALRSPALVAFADTDSVTSTSSLKSKIMLLLLSLCWILTLMALARPTYMGDPIALPSNGRDILLAVDISGSMEREDMLIQGRTVNRLLAVKAVVGDFVVQRKGDRLGLVLFGEKAYLQTPLTFDRETMQELLMEAQIGFAVMVLLLEMLLAYPLNAFRSVPQTTECSFFSLMAPIMPELFNHLRLLTLHVVLM